MTSHTHTHTNRSAGPAVTVTGLPAGTGLHVTSEGFLEGVPTAGSKREGGEKRRNRRRNKG